MRPICGDFRAGGDPGAVWLSRAAQFPAALQCRADPADRRSCGWSRASGSSRWCAGACCRPGSRIPKNFTLLINARGESVIDKPAFRAAMKRRRCLIPADGFYEWKATRATRKRPYFVRAEIARSRSPSPGLWETWTRAERRGSGDRGDRHDAGQRTLAASTTACR